MIEVRGLTKRYGDKLAVDDLTFTVRPGIVTGFLGPNGAGKSTTMRMILGPGRADRRARRPSTAGRTASTPRRCTRPAPCWRPGRPTPAAAPTTTCWRWPRPAASAGRGWTRSMDAVGLREVGAAPGRRFSLGMGQRLGIATALLGDPRTVILDEPLNGLDTEGIRWVRSLLRSLAAEGRTVFVSSHLMNEMALTAEHLIVIGRGRLLADTSIADFIAQAASAAVRVRATDPDALAAALRGAGRHRLARRRRRADRHRADHRPDRDRRPGAGITLLELTAQQASLEEAFMAMTRDAVEYRAPAA